MISNTIIRTGAVEINRDSIGAFALAFVALIMLARSMAMFTSVLNCRHIGRIILGNNLVRCVYVIRQANEFPVVCLLEKLQPPPPHTPPRTILTDFLADTFGFKSERIIFTLNGFRELH